MEKEVKSNPVSVVIKSNDEGSITFQLKEPSKVSKQINSIVTKEYSHYSIGSVVIQPEQNIIDSQKVCLDTSYLF